MTNWVQYEVWAEDDDGHQELIETTASRKQALSEAQKAFNEGLGRVTVYEETTDGDYEMIKEFK
jgi:hypothetical protein